MGNIDEDEGFPFEDEEFPFEDEDLSEDSEFDDFDLSDDEGFGSSSFGSGGFGGSPFGVETCKFDNKTALVVLSVGFVAFVLGYIAGKVS